jgi:hypothetical protein
MPLDLSRWPRTLWNPDGAERKEVCLNCGQGYVYHGAGEIITRKCGFKLNEMELVCRPPGDMNPDRAALPGVDIFGDFSVAIVRLNDT